MRSVILLLALAVIAPATFAAEKSMSVPTDAKAKYTILEIGGKWPNRTIVTKRVGSSGTSYSKRLYNCSNKTVKYLGTGDSPAEMAQSKPDPNMAPIVPQSIADYVGRQACKP
jgi:hypothetical protein